MDRDSNTGYSQQVAICGAVVRVHVQCKKECDCKLHSGAMQNVLLVHA
jgi:hypothetical protein